MTLNFARVENPAARGWGFAGSAGRDRSRAEEVGGPVPAVPGAGNLDAGNPRCRGLSAGAYLWRGAQPTATLSGVQYLSSARKAALAWGREPGVVQDLCRRKEIPGAFKGEDGRYKIPKAPSPPASRNATSSPKKAGE
jgi:hypothetical protein